MRDPRRFLWLDLSESGRPTKAIARRHGVPHRTVQHEITLARGEVAAFLLAQAQTFAPKLVLFFPLNGFFPGSRCTHDAVSIPRGSMLTCAVCHRSGMDGHPALQRYRRYEPRPEVTPSHGQSGSAPATRRQRRKILSDQPDRAGGISAA